MWTEKQIPEIVKLSHFSLIEGENVPFKHVLKK